MMNDPHLITTLPRSGKTSEEVIAQIGRAGEQYQELLTSNSFTRVRRLRDKSVSHLLTSLKPAEVTYEMIYELQKRAEQLAVDLFEVCARPSQKPNFLSKKPTLVKGAKDFWDTYFAAMRSRTG
jgi:hypothetical protein